MGPTPRRYWSGYRVFDLRAGTVHEAPSRRALGLGYRHSGLRPGQVVLRADFALGRGDPESGQAPRWRRSCAGGVEHQPGGSNAGSVFRNPDGDSAGRLVEAAGLRGFRMGSAQVSEKHANFIQADAEGSADDVRRAHGPRSSRGGPTRRASLSPPRSTWWVSLTPRWRHGMSQSVLQPLLQL